MLGATVEDSPKSSRLFPWQMSYGAMLELKSPYLG